MCFKYLTQALKVIATLINVLFRTLSNICDKLFFAKTVNERLKDHRCLTGF